ncbi:MAG: ABC transporter permease [Micropruina sp.]|uniref:ABC transporter permease n=1 Tax=Micropruina sp. TaxID=2737536 RepID=UPI0039E3D151
MNRPSAASLLIGTGTVVLTLLAGIALLGPALIDADQAGQRLDRIHRPPSAANPLGTARLGEDVLLLCLQGLQKSLLIGCVAAVVTTALAALVGTVAGYLGGLLDRLLMTVVDVLLVLPPVLLLAVVLGPAEQINWLIMVAVLALQGWMLTGRVVRARTLSLRTADVVRSAEYGGASAAQIIRWHLLPQMLPLLTIDLVLNVSGAVLSEAGLSYFGFGILPPEVSLGTLIATGTASALTYPWVFLAPVGCLMALVLGTAVLGEGLRLRTEGAATA